MNLNKTKRVFLILAVVFCFLMPFSAGAEVRQVSTEENGKVIETVWKDDTGKACPGPEGYASVRYTYKRDETTEYFYDAEGQPYETAGGYYARRTTRDGKNRVTQIEYLGPEGERILNRQGYAMMAVSYYGFGETRTVTYYGLNKKPVTVPVLGYASILTEYSNKVMTSRTFRNAKGNPVDSRDGYAVVKQKLNKQYQVIRIRYEHADGTPAVGPDGWFRCLMDRDDKGRITSIKYYDVLEQLTDRGADYAWEEREYDGDNIMKVTRYDLAGNKVSDEAGVVTTVRESRDGKVVRESFLDTNGQPVSNTLGVETVVYSYDLGERIERVSYQDAAGAPALCSDGYAGYRDSRDEDGAPVSRTFLGLDGNPVLTREGYSEIRYFYDENKQMTAVRYYDLNGTQINIEK